MQIHDQPPTCMHCSRVGGRGLPRSGVFGRGKLEARKMPHAVLAGSSPQRPVHAVLGGKMLINSVHQNVSVPDVQFIRWLINLDAFHTYAVDLRHNIVR